MNFKVEAEALFASYANEAQGDIHGTRAQPHVTPDVADTMLLQRLADLAHMRQAQVLQSQNDGWFMGNPPMEGPFLQDMCRNNVLGPLVNTPLGHSAGNEQGDCDDEDKYGRSDGDDVSDIKAAASQWESQITDEEKGAVASPQQRPHAAVEKRYRRTVNTKLQQLYMSIPASGRFSPDERAVTGSDENDQAAKPVVLDKAIQYVQHLTETYLKYDADIEELRRQLRDLADRYGISDPMTQPQAEEPSSDMA